VQQDVLHVAGDNPGATIVGDHSVAKCPGGTVRS